MYILFVRFISEFLIFFLVIPFGYFLFKKDWPMVGKIFLTVALTAILRKFTNLIWFEPRPYVVDIHKLVYPIVMHPKDSSFFSGHASTAFVFAGAIFWQHKKFGLIMLTIASLVAVGRVLGGLHYPHDVIVGALVGMVISLLVHLTCWPLIFKKIKNKGVDI